MDSSIFEKIGEYEPGNRIRAILDWEGFRLADGPENVPRPDSVDLIDMARAYMEVVQGESCGKCVPCRMGTRRPSVTGHTSRRERSLKRSPR